jgi:hypothetical protein
MKYIPFVILFLILLIPLSTAQILTLRAPTIIQKDGRGYLIITVLDGETPMTGLSNVICCYVMDPDGDVTVNGSHPTENISGVYFFEVYGTMQGAYSCWATCTVNGKETMDAGLFQVRMDVTGGNISANLSRRIQDEYNQGKSDRQSVVQQVAYMLMMQRTTAQNTTQKTAKTGFLEQLRQTAIGQTFQQLFWSIVLSVAAIFSMTAVTHHRKKTKAMR